MQAFSYLQRKIYDKDYLTLSLIWLGLFIWGALTKLFPYMPPLFGFLLAGAMVLKAREYTIGVLVYFLFFEADRGYFLFSTWLYFYFHTRYLMPLVASIVDCKKCLFVLSIVFGYMLYYLMLFLLGSTFLEHTSYYNQYPVLIYILIESIAILMVNDVAR